MKFVKNLKILTCFFLPIQSQHQENLPIIWKYNYLFSIFCFQFPHFSAISIFFNLTNRCVHSEQRSFALGIQWIVVRIFGTIPAPMIFGSLIDDSCILWQESCNEAGACLVYDNSSLSKYMLYLALTAKLCSTIFFFGAWWSYVPPKHIQQNEAESNTNAQDAQEQEIIIYNNNQDANDF